MSSALTRLEIPLAKPEAELALAEVHAVLAAAGSDEYRVQLADLIDGIESGVLDEGQALLLEPIVELALQAGRIRAIYGPPGETAALRLYRKLPRGTALRRSAEDVSSALTSLAGRRLEGATLAAIGPGAYTLSLATDEGRLTIKLDRQGARVTSIEV